MQRKHGVWLLLLAALRCEAAIYQWTDGTGTVQYSDRPPPAHVEFVERHDIEAATAAAPPVPPPRRTLAKDNARADSPRQSHHKAARASAREQARQHCDKLRQRIATTQAKLRAGYSVRQGIRLTERLRADRDTLYHECRY